MNTRQTRPLLSLAAALAITTAASADTPVSLTVDPALSSVDMTILIDVGVANSSDSDSSTLSGNIEIELDDAGSPLNITLTDLMVVLDNTLNFNWSFGFFGSADATMTNSSISYNTPGTPTGPVPIFDNAFSFPEVLFDLGGQLDVNYDIFLVGSGSEIVDLGSQAPFASVFAGDLSVDGSTVTLSTIIPLDTTQPLTDADGNELGTVTVTGNATIVATGEAVSCPADLTGDGLLNFFDVSAFLIAFNAMDPAADFTGDGLFNFFDVSEFLAAFTAGCP